MTEMMMSVEGLYTADEDLFVGLQVPEGMEKQTVIDSILLECMELEVLYPRPETMKNMIGIWSAKELPTWKRVYAAELAEYNPIENYDRHQTDTRQETHSGDDVTAGTTESNTTGRTTGNTSGSSSGTSSGTSSGQNGTTTNATGNLTDNNLHKFAAFDSGTLLDQNKDEKTAQSTNTQTEQSANEQTSSENVSQTNQGSSEQNQTGTATENKVTTLTHGETVGETFTSYIHGNIGVTTSQQMLESELELAPKINTINYITNSFKMRFCILVY